MYDTVKNPIPKNGFFATPETLDDLQNYVSQFNGAELRIAMLVMMMTLNTCNKLVEDEILSKEIFV